MISRSVLWCNLSRYWCCIKISCWGQALYMWTVVVMVTNQKKGELDVCVCVWFTLADHFKILFGWKIKSEETWVILCLTLPLCVCLSLSPRERQHYLIWLNITSLPLTWTSPATSTSALEAGRPPPTWWGRWASHPDYYIKFKSSHLNKRLDDVIVFLPHEFTAKKQQHPHLWQTAAILF